MKRRILWVVVAAVQLVAALAAEAQIEVRARHEGDWLPIVGCSGDDTYVMKEGKRREAWHSGVRIEPAATFGAGAVKIDKVQVDLDPMRDATPKQRSQPGCIAFSYMAEVSSADEVEDCYALLVFVVNGTVGTHLFPIGRLHPGKARGLKVELTTRIDSVARLHVFSRSAELKSNQVTEAYDVRKYWASLERSSAGVSAAALCKSEEQFPVALSRDGRLLATSRDKGDHYAILVYDLTSMKVVCEVATSKEYDEIKNPIWTSDRDIAFISGERNLMVVNIDRKTCETLRKDVRSILQGQPTRPEVIVILCNRGWDVWTSQYNVRERKTVDWDSLNDGWTQFDANGRPRLRYVLEGDRKKYFCRPPSTDRWTSLDPTVKESGLKFSIHGGEELDRVANIESVGPDGDTLYISTRLGTDTFQLAAYSLSKGTITQTIAKHPKYDLTESDFGMARQLFQPTTGALVGMVYEGAKPQVIWWDAGYAAVQKAMERSFPGQFVLPLAWAEDDSTFIYFVGSDQNPGTYYAFRPAESKLVVLFDQGVRLKDLTLAKTTSLDFTARDGATIHGYLTLPPEPTAGPLPLVVNIHGGPTVRDSWHFDATNQFLATRGYAVLQVNYRGSSGYGATYQKAGLRARLDTVVLDDIADGVRHLIKAGTVDPQRVAVIGGSFGGWATYMSLIKYPELYRAGVAIAAVSHLRQLLKDARHRFDNRFGYAFWKDLLEKADFAENEKFIDPLLREGEIHQPVYIMHGEWDTVVHPTQARDMLKALQKHNPNVESMSFPRASHTWWPFNDRVTQLNEIEAFLRRHLAVAAPAAASVPAPGS